MAFLDFISNRNASPQQSVAQTPQPAAPSLRSLPANVKSQAVEAARPAAQLMEQATTPRTAPTQPQAPQAPQSPARGRSLGMER